MGKPKSYLRRSINLGGPGDPARIIAENYIKVHGKCSFSVLIRKLIQIHFSRKEANKEWRIAELKHNYREAHRKIKEQVVNRDAIANELREYGIEPSDFLE